MIVCVPPLAEQHGIVAKVNGLVAIGDQLEPHLASAQTERSRLLQAVLHRALADTPAALLSRNLS
jgi:type I restriction enzyme S subunit